MTFNRPAVLNPTLTFLLKPVAIRSICNGLPVRQVNAAEYYNPKENATDYTFDDFYELVNRLDHSSDESYDQTTDFEASENHINGAEPSCLGIDVLEGYQNTDYSTNGNGDSDMENDDTFGYPPEHSVQVMDPSKQYDIDHTDDSYELVNKSDQSSDESFEFGGSEESYDRTTDFEENENHRSEAEPSGSGTDVLDEGYQSTNNSTSGNEDSDIENEDAFGYPPEHSVQEDNVAYFCTPSYVRMLKFPKCIRRRDDMRLRDVVEEHALHVIPAKSVCRFKAVSREWSERIVRPIFPYEQSESFRLSSVYFNKYLYSPQFISLNGCTYSAPSPILIFLPEPVTITSSCKGLLLCQGTDGKYYVCKPVPKEQDVLTQPKFYHWETLDRVLSAFDMKDKFCLVQQILKQRIQNCTMSYVEGEICYVSAYAETGNTCVIDICVGFSTDLKRNFNVELPFVLRGAVRGRIQLFPCVNEDCLACVVGNGALLSSLV